MKIVRNPLERSSESPPAFVTRVFSDYQIQMDTHFVPQGQLLRPLFCPEFMILWSALLKKVLQKRTMKLEEALEVLEVPRDVTEEALREKVTGMLDLNEVGEDGMGSPYLQERIRAGCGRKGP